MGRRVLANIARAALKSMDVLSVLPWSPPYPREWAAMECIAVRRSV